MGLFSLKAGFLGDLLLLKNCYPGDRDTPFTVLPGGQGRREQMGFEKKVPGKV